MVRQGKKKKEGKNLTYKWCIPLHLMKISCTEGQVPLKTELPAFEKNIKEYIYIYICTPHTYIYTFNYTGLLKVLPSATQEVCKLQNKARKCDSNRSVQVT